MTSLAALRDGITRVNRAPVVVISVCIGTLLISAPMGMVMGDAIREHLGNSMAAEQAARSVNMQWWTEFEAEAGPLARTFQPTIIGFAAVLSNLSALADGEWRPAPILFLGIAYLTFWLFLAGGIIDRYARGRATRSYEFFTACGVYFVRFLRLAPFAAAAYYLLFAVLHPLLFDTAYEALTRNVTVERRAFLIRLGLYAAFGVALAVVNVLFDYAKVRAVVEDRRSMVGAILASARFVRRNAPGVAALYSLNVLAFTMVIFLYAAISYAAGSAGLSIWFGVAAGQLYLLARVWTRLLFFATETALFQGRLAHAGYVARAPLARPVPPIVERLVE